MSMAMDWQNMAGGVGNGNDVANRGGNANAANGAGNDVAIGVDNVGAANLGGNAPGNADANDVAIGVDNGVANGVGNYVANPAGNDRQNTDVGVANDVTNPGGNANAANPGGNANVANPGGNAGIANLGGNANATNPGGNADAANPGGNANATNPVGNADVANPGGNTNAANPVGIAAAANPVGNANTAGNDVANGVENDVSVNPVSGDADQVNVRAESDYSRPTKRDPRGMRTGYTTGTTAAAAAKAAVILMLSGKAPAAVSVPLPGGTGRAELAVQRSWAMDPAEGVRCSAIKDGGDDPDVTHGAEIIVGVWRLPDGMQGLQITGGPGVGTVTRPGTGIEVGEPAVTRVPRRMMADAVGEGLVECGWPADTGVRARISVVDGEKIAEQTTNARLGVLGGISILGSTGVVQPFSTAAWRASVHLAIDVAAANGVEHLVLSTGTRSEEYTRRVLDLPDMAYIEAGIFSGPAMKRCVNKGIKRVSHVGMVGKFSKMAMGHFVTHVAGNRVDTEFLAGLAGRCGASETLQAEMRDAASGRHFQELAQEHEVMGVFPMMCTMVCDEGRRYLGADGDAIIIDALCYDFEGNLLGAATTTPDGIPLRRDDGAAGV